MLHLPTRAVGWLGSEFAVGAGAEVGAYTTANLASFSYAHDRPTFANDPDGRWVHIAIGAAVGAVALGGYEYYRQVAAHEPRSWGRVAAFAGGGAAAGALTAATFGALTASIPELSVPAAQTVVATAGASGAVEKSEEWTAAISQEIGSFSPVNPGPLAQDIAETFRGATYEASVLTEETTLYRVIGNGGNPNGAFWTRTQPMGPLQSVIDSALDQNWGNTATTIIPRVFPAGTRIFEGVAAPQGGLVPD